jgi:hypothetical protein
MSVVTQRLNLTQRWKGFSTNIIWPTLGNLHEIHENEIPRSYGWSVRILLTNSMYYPNFSLVGMHRPGRRCTELIEKTANALDSVIALMLFAVQKDNLELNINQAVKR